jgi:hypothetical protein
MVESYSHHAGITRGSIGEYPIWREGIETYQVVLDDTSRALSDLAFPPPCQTYVLGISHGFNQGKKQGVLDAQLAMQTSPSVEAKPQNAVPAAAMTPM